MGRFTAYNDNYWACDFETLTPNTNYFKEYEETRVWLAYAKKFNPNNKPQIDDEILTLTIEEFFDEFWKRKESATLFFHNLYFDGEFIKWYLVRNGYKYFYETPARKTQKGFMVFEDEKNIYFINVFKKVRDGQKMKIVQLYIRCSKNLLTLSIDSLAKAYNLPYKQSINYDVEPFEKLEDVPKELIEYIKRDVDIMIPPLQQFNKVFTITHGNRIVEGLSKLTIGSVSLMLFKAFVFGNYKFKKDFFLPYEKVVDLRSWYSGGLTTFNPNYQYSILDKIDGRVYDVNSMYPSVMVDYEYPLGDYIESETQPDARYKIKLVKIYIKEAKIKNPNYPPLMRPWQSPTFTYPKNSRFITETKNAIAYYFEDELISLKRFYHIEYDVLRTLWFRSEKYFASFISKHYELRKEYKKAGDPRQETIKLLLNSAYGKFGQNPDKTTIVYSKKVFDKGDLLDEVDNLVVDVVRQKDSCIEDLNSYICYYDKPPEKSINVIIAAAVTKNARLKLHNAIWENIDNFLYCDTDSIFIKGEAKGIEIDENKLGAWKEEMVFDAIELGGAKLYNLYLKNVKVKSAHAGINKKWAEKNLKPNDIITINKKLDKGSKIIHRKVKGGVILEETEFTIKERR